MTRVISQLKLSTVSLLLLTPSLYASDRDFDWVQDSLQEFRRDTKNFMMTPPSLTKESTTLTRTPDDSELAKHMNLRRLVMGRGLKSSTQSRAEPKPGDMVRDLLGNDIVNFAVSIPEMAARNLNTGSVQGDIWSGDYWATFKGGLGARYADPDFPATYDWKANYDYINTNPRDQVLQQFPEEGMSRLSPAEKFDLLVGAEANRGLANYSWQDGKRIFDAMGEIEGWFGLCHGWAPAAYEMHRPYKTLTLVAADGKTKIDFRPDDLKALYTYWWSTNDFSTRFVGSRCETASPATDPDSGRIVEANCYDNNAATWHLAVVNQVGVNRSSFIIDASLDRQVWNQPVKSYSFTYFNPKTDTEAQDWQTGKVNLSDFPEDKFKKFRSPRAVAVVGIAMNLSYLAEHGSNPIDTDTADQDSVNTVHYVYDLEIDAQGTIVGGEWYQNYHPDFLWMPVRGTRPSHSLDRQLTGVWDLAKPIPENWKKPAQTASRSGHILGPILEKINQTFANP